MIEQVFQMQKTPGVSLYHQIKQDLRIKIEPLEPGTKIETEQQLSAYYGVSRGTIRQAITDLVNEGLLQKIQGSGTFRSNNHGIHMSYFVNRTFTQQLLETGKVPGIADIKLETVAVSAQVAKHLKISEGAEVFKLSRVRLSDGIPFGVGTAYIRKEYVPNLQESDLEMSLVDMMETKYGIIFSNRNGYCFAVPASAELAATLSVRPNSPILQIDYIFCDQLGIPLMIDMMQLSSNFRLVLEAAEVFAK